MTDTPSLSKKLGRRSFLGLGATAVVAGGSALIGSTSGFAPPAYAALSIPKPKRRDLKLFSINTEESFAGTYWADGRYVPGALKQIATVLRDRRDNTQHKIDPAVLDVLVSLRDLLGTNAPIHVICGYRSPRSNAMMHAASSSVASNSYHVKGMAIDLRVPNRPLALVKRAAMHLGRGGVGYYPSSDFVHVDSGPVRHW